MSSTNTNTESSTTVTTGPTISNIDTTPPTPASTPRIAPTPTSSEEHLAWIRQVNNIRNTSTDQFVLNQLPPQIVRQYAFERDY